MVTPSISVLAEPPVAVVDRVVDRRGTRAVAEAYLRFLYTDEGQRIAVRHFYRPRSPAVLAEARGRFPELELFTVASLGGWKAVQATALRRRRHLRPDLRGEPMTAPARRGGGALSARLFGLQPSPLPGFGPAMGITLLYLSLIVLIPLSMVVLRRRPSSAPRASGRPR